MAHHLADLSEVFLVGRLPKTSVRKPAHTGAFSLEILENFHKCLISFIFRGLYVSSELILCKENKIRDIFLVSKFISNFSFVLLFKARSMENSLDFTQSHNLFSIFSRSRKIRDYIPFVSMKEKRK